MAPEGEATEAPDFWGGLEAGPYGVGFRVIETYDFSRTWRRKTTLDGQPQEGVRARPMQISLWYPATTPGLGSSPMELGHYLELTARETSFEPWTEEDRRAFREGWVERRARAGLPRRRLEAVLTAPMAALREAPPAAGRFPLVVFAQGFGASPWIEALLCEYLASHGWAVATSPSMGPSSRPMVSGFVGLETQVRDLEFLIAHLHGRPEIDPDRLAAVGYSFGGASAVMLGMHHSDVDAVVSLDGSDALGNIVPYIRRWPHFDPAKAQAPYLRIDAGPRQGDDLSLFQDLRYAERYRVTLPDLRHLDFAILGIVSKRVPGFLGPALGDPQTGYEWICRYVLRFLDAALGANAESRLEGRRFLERPPRENGVPRRTMRVEHFPAERPAPPTEEQFTELLRSQGVEGALETLRRLRRGDPQLRPVALHTLYALGGWCLSQDRPDDAVLLYRYLAEIYPPSWEAYDSLGDAYRHAGARNLAAQSYRQSLQLRADNDATRRKLREVTGPGG